VAWVEIGGDAEAVHAWVADDTVPLRIVSGPPGPRRFALRTTTGIDITIN
jgi:hypothetical protein